jgi:NAD(P)-dependent dehydrogenase (short-subunit alcohol dehydrogenase family)
MDSFAGKVAVVTGGASGIGLALVQRFATERMKVVVADVEEEALEAATKALGDEFGDDAVLGVVTDVRSPEAVTALADTAFSHFGGVHVLCNNAGVAVGGLSWMVPADRWQWIVDVNLLGVVNGIRAFVPRMIEQGEGHVVNTASIAGIVTAPAMGPYVATKHAVVGLTESLYFDLQLMGNGVGASVLCPEWVRTRIYESERNRPDDVGEMTMPIVREALPDTDASESEAPASDDAPVDVGSVVAGMVNSGIDPADVAETVLQAIIENRFWIFTHDTSLANVKRRHEAIESNAHPIWWGQ